MCMQSVRDGTDSREWMLGCVLPCGYRVRVRDQETRRSVRCFCLDPLGCVGVWRHAARVCNRYRVTVRVWPLAVTFFHSRNAPESDCGSNEICLSQTSTETGPQERSLRARSQSRHSV